MQVIPSGMARVWPMIAPLSGLRRGAVTKVKKFTCLRHDAVLTNVHHDGKDPRPVE